MRKQDLRDGDRLTLREGSLCIVFGNNLMQEAYKFQLNDYNDNLTNRILFNFDIIKVERIQFDKSRDQAFGIAFVPATTYYANVDYINSNLTYQTIWEIEEPTSDFEEMIWNKNCEKEILQAKLQRIREQIENFIYYNKDIESEEQNMIIAKNILLTIKEGEN